MYTQQPAVDRGTLVLRNKMHVSTFLGKPLVLVLAISTILTSIISAILSFVTSSAFISTYGRDIQSYLNSILDSNSNVNITNSYSVNLTAPSFALLTFIALLLMFIGAKKINGSPAKAGVLIYRIIGIISLIGSIIAMVFMILATFFCLFMIVMISTNDMREISDAVDMFDVPTLTVFFAVLGVFLICSGIYTLISGISFSKFSGSIYKSYNSEVLSAKGSKLFAAMNIISVILPVMAAVFYLLMIPVTQANPMVVVDGVRYNLGSHGTVVLLLSCAASSLVSVITPIISAVFALSYNKHIKAAGRNGEYLPMPVIEPAPYTAQYATAVPAAPVVPVVPVAPVVPDAETNAEPEIITESELSSQEPVVSDEKPVSEAPSAPVETAIPDTMPEPADEPDITEVNPYAMPEPTPKPVAPTPQEPVAPTPQPVANFCHNCGNRITPDQNFCNRCGTKLK